MLLFLVEYYSADLVPERPLANREVVVSFAFNFTESALTPDLNSVAIVNGFESHRFEIVD